MLLLQLLFVTLLITEIAFNTRKNFNPTIVIWGTEWLPFFPEGFQPKIPL